MGREFLDIFEGWAERYDSTVSGHDEEYKEVFREYNTILDTVVHKSLTTVLEFGVGTGNLTQKLLENDKMVYGIEPSKPMREIAFEKLSNKVDIQDGDFLEFPRPQAQIDTIVSSYAFHHLNDQEKEQAIGQYGMYLQKGGKIVFADTMFENEQAYEKTIADAKEKGYLNLANDLETEYYTTIESLQNMCEKHGFTANFTRINHFVWIMEAIKQL